VGGVWQCLKRGMFARAVRRAGWPRPSRPGGQRPQRHRWRPGPGFHPVGRQGLDIFQPPQYPPRLAVGGGGGGGGGNISPSGEINFMSKVMATGGGGGGECRGPSTLGNDVILNDAQVNGHPCTGWLQWPVVQGRGEDAGAVTVGEGGLGHGEHEAGRERRHVAPVGVAQHRCLHTTAPRSEATSGGGGLGPRHQESKHPTTPQKSIRCAIPRSSGETKVVGNGSN
jgi:hypothetical protein